MLEGVPELVREAEAEVSIADVSPELMEALDALEPYGQDNPEPVLYLSGAAVLGIRPMRSNGLKLWLGSKDESAVGVIFSHQGPVPRPGDRVDLAFNLEWDTYTGPRAVRLKILQMVKRGES